MQWSWTGGGGATALPELSMAYGVVCRLGVDRYEGPDGEL